MRRRALLIITTMGLLAGCGSAGAKIIASPDEYASYRAVRTAGSLDAKLSATARYLDAYSQGAFHGEVARFYERAEPLYFEARKGSRAGLVAYLEALPSGPHAEEARHRLSIFARKEAR